MLVNLTPDVSQFCLSGIQIPTVEVLLTWIAYTKKAQSEETINWAEQGIKKLSFEAVIW